MAFRDPWMPPDGGILGELMLGTGPSEFKQLRADQTPFVQRAQDARDNFPSAQTAPDSMPNPSAAPFGPRPIPMVVSKARCHGRPRCSRPTSRVHCPQR